MNVGTSISVEEYLRTSYDNPDREFRDGELEERSLPDTLHAMTQLSLGSLFLPLRAKFNLYAMTEVRVRIREGLILIPDIAVFRPNKPLLLPTEPPFIAIEILSPDDRLARVRAKLDEYRSWGVPHVWLVDPHQRRMYTCDGVLAEVASLRVPEIDLEILPQNIFE